ncbi:IS256 family transposase, partial [Rhizobium leguminosarum]|uniref:IS256 family transposase n=1 Tax=Rhizobium leguminosarum TaxID=384 RepID=UPI000518CD15
MCSVGANAAFEIVYRDCQEFCAGGHDDEKERIITWLSKKELLDQLLAGRDPSEVFGKDGLLDDLKRALSERILNAELDEHLDVERSEGTCANRRNGSSKKTVLTGTSKMTLAIPRDRAGTFDPKLI